MDMDMNNGRRFHRTSEVNNGSKLIAIDSVWQFQTGERIRWYRWSICKPNFKESNHKNIAVWAIIYDMLTDRTTNEQIVWENFCKQR